MKHASFSSARLLALYDRISDAEEAVPRLRRFVLDLAARGKLVDQDASDEPAAELLKRTAKEKARLVKAKAIRKPKDTVPLEADNLPFPLPHGWTWTQIAHLGVISPRNEADEDFEASFVPMPLIAAEYGVENGQEPRPWSEIKKGYTHFAEGDVGLAKITPCFENGKSTVFRGLAGGIGAGTTELHIVRPLFVDADYILVFLKCSHFIETGIPKMTGTAGQKRVPTEYFTSSPFPLPPLAEQHRIVAKVDELMALCDQLEQARAEREAVRDQLTTASLARLTAPETDAEALPAEVGTGSASGNATNKSTFQSHARFALQSLPMLTTRPDQIKALRQTILNLAVRGKLVEQDAEDEPAAALLEQVKQERKDLMENEGVKIPKIPSLIDVDKFPFQIPSSWTWVRLGNLVLHSDAGWSPQTLNHARVDKEWGVLKVSAVSWETFDPKANKQVLPGTEPRLQAKVNKGDFLISRANTSELVARAVLVDDEPENLMMSDKIVRLRIAEASNRRFIWMVNNRPDYARAYYAANATGVSPSMKNVSRQAILGLPIPLPPLAEQHRIVAKVDALMALCDRLEASLTTTAATRSKLLNALLHEALEPVNLDLEAAQ